MGTSRIKKALLIILTNINHCSTFPSDVTSADPSSLPASINFAAFYNVIKQVYISDKLKTADFKLLYLLLINL